MESAAHTGPVLADHRGVAEVDFADLIRRLGWSATWRDLTGVGTERQVRDAVRSRIIVRIGRGRYGLPGAGDLAREAAVRVNGIVSHTSAAIRWGMAVRTPPPLPTITVPRGRKLSAERRRGVAVHWADLDQHDAEDGVTLPARTILDCAARLPLPEALVVADSALARRLVSRPDLERRAAAAPPKVRARVSQVIDLADGRAQSAFESLVRGYALDIPGLSLEPQVLVGRVHPDLYDRRLRLGVECDSYEFHSKRADLLSDCERYNEFALGSVMLIRFGWEHSMNRPEYIRQTLAQAVVVRERELGLAA